MFCHAALGSALMLCILFKMSLNHLALAIDIKSLFLFVIVVSLAFNACISLLERLWGCRKV